MTGIYRQNDIRGKFGKDLSLTDSKKIGYAINKLVGKRKLLLAYDNRLSSVKIKDALISERDGLIIDLGEIPTPVFYYAMDLHRNYFGVMITASHLPKEYNGFKINHGKYPLTFATGIKKVEKMAKKYRKEDHNPIIKKLSINNRYLNHVTRKIRIRKKLLVAVDGGNGVAGPFLIEALKRLGCNVIPYHCKLDGNFPNHVPNPLIDNTIKDFAKIVKQKNADIGIALDGDGDRIRIISPGGKIMESETIISLLAKELLAKNPKSQVVYSINCSDLVKHIVKINNGIPFEERVGHSFIKNSSIRKNAVLSGEYSGHIGFRENNYNDDGIFAGLKLCELISKNPNIWQEAIIMQRMYHVSSEFRIKLNEKQRLRVLDKFYNMFKKYRISKKDGLKIYFKPGVWAILRSSNTEDVISLRTQGQNNKEVNLIRNLFMKKLRNLIY